MTLLADAMNNKNHSVTELDDMIELLVDGQLGGDRYREAIRAIEKSRDGWRRCAVAFLQEQAIKQELRQLARSGLCENGPARPAHNDHQYLRDELTVAGNGERASWRSIANRINVLALAASILVAFGMGWYGAGMRVWNSDDVLGNPAPRSSARGNVFVGSSAPHENDSDGFTYDPSRLVLDQGMGIVPVQHEIPESLRRLERLGVIRLETTNGVYPFELDDGRAAIMPVQQIRVQPVLHAY